jgi:hypothetical protein
LYAVDTRSGHGYNPGGRISRVADHIHREVEKSFNPDAVKRVDMEEMKKEPVSGANHVPRLYVLYLRE